MPPVRQTRGLGAPGHQPRQRARATDEPQLYTNASPFITRHHGVDTAGWRGDL